MPCCMVSTPDRINFGSMADQGAEAVWNGDAYQAFRDALSTESWAPPEVAEHLREHYLSRLRLLQGRADGSSDAPSEERSAAYSRLQQEGEIESFEPVILEPHGGELGGFFLVRGDQDKLARIRGSEEFERRTVRGDLIVENLGIVSAALGDRLMSQMAVYGQQVEELT